MAKHLEKIEAAHKLGHTSLDIARQVYFLFSTHVFSEATERQFSLYKDVAEFFQISFGSIHVVGSAKTGISLVKGTDFDPLTSDIDIALIDPALYLYYVELSFTLSNGWKDRSAFPIRDDRSTRDDFLAYLEKGIFRPDLMPNCRKRGNWLSFFGQISSRYADVCGGISACIYASSVFFEWKQKSAIECYFANKGIQQ